MLALARTGVSISMSPSSDINALGASLLLTIVDGGCNLEDDDDDDEDGGESGCFISLDTFESL